MFWWMKHQKHLRWILKYSGCFKEKTNKQTKTNQELVWLFEFWSKLAAFIGEGNGTPLHDSCLENPMDGGAWQVAVHGVAKSRTRLSDFTFTFHFHALKEMATHSSVLAWRIPGMGEPGGLLSMGSHRVGHDWSDLAVSAFITEENFYLNRWQTITLKSWVFGRHFFSSKMN